jgi:hypothetical protein
LLDTVTYPDASVAEYMSAYFVLHKASMDKKESWPLFRENHIIWTPSVGCADRNGSMHYTSPGYLPPSEFLSALRIGRARCLMAWTRSAEAIKDLEAAAAVENAMTAEAIFWLSVATYLERKGTARMYALWEELRMRYPDSPWTMRTYDPPSFVEYP